jgi:tight adherence protein C
MNLLVIGAGVGLLLIFFLTFLFVGRRSPDSALLARVTSEAYGRHATGGRPTWVSAENLAKPFGWLRELFSGEPNPEIVRRLILAGYRKPYLADVFAGTRLALPVIAGLLVAVFVKDNLFIWFILAIVLGFLAPDFWLNRAIATRRKSIDLSLPDTLDLLAICMEAGLGLDQAIVKVGQELRLSHPELSEELVQINLEQRAGNPRIGAWRNMADRVAVESVRSFVNMLVQTERFGTPISKALGTFSDALRTQRRQRAEEFAAKTTIKLVLPLAICIFPCIFIVTVAPAIITLMNSFSKIFK